MDVEFRHLRYFVAVAEETSFTAAARRVHVAQQVLSTQVRQLEGVLGVDLLQRSSRGVVLTPAGLAFLDGARQTLRALERTAESARNIGNAIVGTLTIGLSVAAGGDEPTRLLAEFRQRCPHIKLQLHTYELTHPSAGLLNHKSDVAFVRPPVSAEGVTTRALGQEPRVFVLSSGHPLAARHHLEWDDVVGLPWVAAGLATDGCEPTAWRDALMVNPRPTGERPVIGAVANTVDEWREYVVAGAGINLCPASCQTHYARPGLSFVPANGVPPAELCLAWRTDDPNPAVKRFVEVVSEAVEGGASPARQSGYAAEQCFSDRRRERISSNPSRPPQTL